MRKKQTCREVDDLLMAMWPRGKEIESNPFLFKKNTHFISYFGVSHVFTIHFDYMYLPSLSLSFLGPSFILSKPLISFLKVNTQTGPCAAWILMGVGTL